MPQTLPKSARLKSLKVIKALFLNSVSEYQFPLKVLALPQSKVEPMGQVYGQLLVSVSKKNFKKAVDRNRIKRLLREAFRRNQDSFVLSHYRAIALIYTHKEILTYSKIESSLRVCFAKLRA
jgi:ribonuclease P protein component